MSDLPENESNQDTPPESSADLEQEAMSAAILPEVRGGDDDGSTPRVLGVRRWVQFAFIALALTVAWLLTHLTTLVWNQFAEPKENWVAGASALGGIVLALFLYRHRTVGPWAMEVAQELAKVTWPTRQETWKATVIVVVTSLIAAALLFGFDAAWSSVTDLIYKV